MEKIDNIEFYISCYFGVILSTICQVLRHFTWMSSNMADGNQQKHLLLQKREFILRETHKH